ncbi:TRAP-type mannitol/chloroaromatic compound transport system, small permease component [Limimonas halophila]|uniref:TRAP transporter small permease protein n=1 Tax=Limimonas halophila TaxID=1082479 RepID=A0A1G7P0E3_9PROT|nr:TRAP transporter small permease subunit [Limimonas halophila]SDF79766.1 TRAP-type mannitol/chloroaromatic compound transport system, small permease component [Limimonas halophila]
MNALASLVRGIDRLNEGVGRGAAWLTILLVLVQFVVVILRYVFGVGSLWLQELIVYLHAFNFMLGSGYTLLHDGHVRVDILYRGAAMRHKAWVDLLGSIVLLIPVCVLIFLYSYPYVANAWASFEGSEETSGIQAVFLLKTVILAFAVLVGLQALSLAARSLLRLLGRPLADSSQATPEHA